MILLYSLPSRWCHDTSSSVHTGSTATPSLRCVMIHSKVVSQFMSQSHGSTERVIRVILKHKIHKTTSMILYTVNKTNTSHYCMFPLPSQDYIRSNLSQSSHTCFSLRKLWRLFHMAGNKQTLTVFIITFHKSVREE